MRSCWLPVRLQRLFLHPDQSSAGASYKIHADHKPRAWIDLDGAVDLHENRDNVSTVNDIEHSRSYSFVTTFMPKSKAFFNLGYTYTDIYTQAQICYYDNPY